MVRKDAKSPVKKTAEEIRTDLRRRFGPVGLDPSDPTVELEIELVAQLARIATALEYRNDERDALMDRFAEALRDFKAALL